MEDWVGDYIGIPFTVGGRAPDTGFDCWGLVRYVMAVEYGKLLPGLEEKYSDLDDKRNIENITDTTKPLIGARSVREPAAGDLVLMRYRGFICHVGIMVDDRNVLHTDYGKDSCVQRIDSIHLRDRVEGFYRVL